MEKSLASSSKTNFKNNQTNDDFFLNELNQEECLSFQLKRLTLTGFNIVKNPNTCAIGKIRIWKK